MAGSRQRRRGDPGRTSSTARTRFNQPGRACGDGRHGASRRGEDALHPARRAIARPKASRALTATAARRTVHSKTASYTYCSVGVFGLGKCAFWHATAKERFYYDGTKAFATLPLNNTNTYVNCADYGGTGYAVSVAGCGFLGRNPAPYGNGSYLLGREDFNVSLLIKGFAFQDHGYIEFHNFGDGFVGIHHGR